MFAVSKLSRGLLTRNIYKAADYKQVYDGILSFEDK
jgi:hypothetical protein